MLCLTLIASLLPIATFATPTAGKHGHEQQITQQEFIVEFSTSNPANYSDPIYHPAQAVSNTSTQIVLVALSPGSSLGTPAFVNYTNQTTDSNGFLYGALDFDLTNCQKSAVRGIYGAYAPSVGSNYGLAIDISLVKGQQFFDWLYTASTGGLFHRVAAGSNGFFACNRTIQGKTQLVLDWGAYRTTPVFGAPDGCEFTSVRTRNITQSARKQKCAV
nr:hypothetical protein B0A51_02279 [Rachicladosporium sp. CCFEE 5018]